MADKTMKQLQDDVHAYISQYKEGYFPPLAMVARLAEEVGELAREVNHRFGPKPKKTTEEESSIELELGDILFVLISFANAQGIDLAQAHDRVLQKFRTRDAGRWTPANTEP